MGSSLSGAPSAGPQESLKRGRDKRAWRVCADAEVRTMKKRLASSLTMAALVILSSHVVAIGQDVPQGWKLSPGRLEPASDGRVKTGQ